MADWNDISIIECGEPLIKIDPSIKRLDPHPYVVKGAKYPKGFNPFMLRQTPAEALTKVNEKLRHDHPELQLIVYDAYRSVDIQKQMVAISIQEEFKQAARKLQIEVRDLPENAKINAKEIVDTIWADPSMDSTKPPPHSTGGAIDLTIFNNASGALLEMGVGIDDTSCLAKTYAYQDSSDPEAMQWHQNRMFLKDVMESAGFTVNTNEWWHFDMGTQKQVHELSLRGSNRKIPARYGRYDIVKP